MRHVDPTAAAAAAIPADPRLADLHATAQALVERQLHLLTGLAEMGMRIAEATERWALAAADAAVASAAASGSETGAAAPTTMWGDPGLSFARVARAVRLTLMLQTRLIKDLPALGRAEALARSAQQQARRERGHRLIKQAIRAEHHDADTVEELSDEAWERLRDEDLDEDLGDVAVGDIVGRICRDLGLSPEARAWAVGVAAATAAPSGDPPPPDSPADGTAPVLPLRRARARPAPPEPRSAAAWAGWSAPRPDAARHALE